MRRGSLERQDPEDRMVSLDELVHLGQRGNQGGAYQELKAPWGPRGFLDSQERREA